MDVGDANMELKDFIGVEATSKGVGDMILTYSTLKVVLMLFFNLEVLNGKLTKSI